MNKLVIGFMIEYLCFCYIGAFGDSVALLIGTGAVAIAGTLIMMISSGE